MYVWVDEKKRPVSILRGYKNGWFLLKEAFWAFWFATLDQLKELGAMLWRLVRLVFLPIYYLPLVWSYRNKRPKVKNTYASTKGPMTIAVEEVFGETPYHEVYGLTEKIVIHYSDKIEKAICPACGKEIGGDSSIQFRKDHYHRACFYSSITEEERKQEMDEKASRMYKYYYGTPEEMMEAMEEEYEVCGFKEKDNEK